MVDTQRVSNLDAAVERTPALAKLAGVRRLVALALALVLLTGLVSGPLAEASPALMGSNSPPTYNNLDNLIADIFDEADDRLKKSKLNSARQVKQTLRFGRRSDPWMPLNAPAEQMTIEELQNRLYGSVN